jgi:Fis family transcriptional regulator
MNKHDIENCVRSCVEHYLRDLRGSEPNALHELFLGVAEKPLLEVVLQHADGNQSKAAQWLGINRNTLRRKLVEHRIAT